MSDYSPCCGVPHQTVAEGVDHLVVAVRVVNPLEQPVLEQLQAGWLSAMLWQTATPHGSRSEDLTHLQVGPVRHVVPGAPFPLLEGAQPEVIRAV